MGDLYMEIMIWKAVDSASAVRYSCLRDLKNGKFAVQSADFFRRPLGANQNEGFARQFAELFIEVPPRERCTWFDSLEEAIGQHESEFS